MGYFFRLALAAAAVSLSLQDAGAQTAPAVPTQATSQQPSFSPLTTRWTFPDPGAVNAGTVTIITAPAGGAKSVFAADMARVLDELRPIVDVREPPIESVVTRWPGAFPQYAPGHLDRVAAIEAGVARLPALALAGAAFHGVGIPACVGSGRRAADAILGTAIVAEGSPR